MKKLIAVIILMSLAACNKSEKVWIVLDLEVDKKPAQMAFDNPSVPDMTLRECQDGIEEAIPNLMPYVSNDPKLKNAKLIGYKCVESVEDPIK